MILLLLELPRAFTLPELSPELTVTCKMASGSTTSAFTDSDNTQILDSECNDYTSRTGKEDPTIIASKVTVITEKKKLKVCTKIYGPTCPACLLSNEDIRSSY